MAMRGRRAVPGTVESTRMTQEMDGEIAIVLRSVPVTLPVFESSPRGVGLQ